MFAIPLAIVLSSGVGMFFGFSFLFGSWNLFATRGQESSEFRKSCEVVCLDDNLDFVLHRTAVGNKRVDVSSTA